MLKCLIRASVVFVRELCFLIFLAAACAAQQSGSFQIGAALKAQGGAEIDHHRLRFSDYPEHRQTSSTFEDELGRGRETVVTHTGRPGAPVLVLVQRDYDSQPFGDLEVKVRNETTKPITVQSVRVLEADAPPNLGGPLRALRVMGDHYSEGEPQLGDLARARGVTSMLLYNRESHQSLFLGAVTSRRFLTVIRMAPDSFTVDSTGTPRGELNVDVPPGGELASERVMFSIGSDYHRQLEAYGNTVRILKKARVEGPTLMGWWSWTAYYSQINEGTLLTNITWLAENLRKLGFEYFHIDEGYMYARGEYATPDAARFPHGMRPIGRAINGHGLKFGIWVAPFEVSDRSWIYEHHKDWLVRDAAGQPIVLGKEVTQHDSLFALDTTHPDAQAYLRQTYRTLVQEWGVRYIKLDFMDDSAVEGYRFRPNTTALEAQQIGLAVVRGAVGDEVLLDKDGSPVLNTVGYVDQGRISVDTAHDFARTKSVARGIAARYYMHRNFFVSDPDAFCISKQTIAVKGEFPKPLTQSEAETSIVLAAVSGGMFEIGDDLPTLGAEPERLALVTNQDLLRMAKLSRASVPLDLMTYTPEDEQPSIFFLRENRRQAMLAVFNWTEQPRSHTIRFVELQLAEGRPYKAFDVLAGGKPIALGKDAIPLTNQPPHSVRLLKIVDSSIPPAPPTITVHAPATGIVGTTLHLTAEGDASVSYSWNFGDGTSATGSKVEHAYTAAGDFPIELTAEGVDGSVARRSSLIRVTGAIRTPFPLSESRRYAEH